MQLKSKNMTNFVLNVKIKIKIFFVLTFGTKKHVLP